MINRNASSVHRNNHYPLLAILTVIVLAMTIFVVFRFLRPADVMDKRTTSDEATEVNAMSLVSEIKQPVKPVVSLNPGFLGPEACKECHPQNYAGASQSNHFRSCRKVVASEMPDGFQDPQNRVETRYDGLSFRMIERADQFWMQTLNRTNNQSITDSRLDLVLGSGGKFDDVFLNWREDGAMYELPVVWLYPSSEWATSHFDPNAGHDHSRPLTLRCLECHNTWIQYVTGTKNVYTKEKHILGVTCESCHGPASQHVDFHRTNPEIKSAEHIIHPGKLSRDMQVDVCSQCHSNSMKRRIPAFEHRSNKPLDESYLQLTTQHHEDDHVANQTKFLRSSKCFQSDQTMTCVTCHDPHSPNTTPTNSIQHQLESCTQCHIPDNCKDRINLPEALQDRCVDCHMPPYIKINVNFRTASDNFVTPIRRWQHDIAIYPQARKELLRDWYDQQQDAASKAKAEKLTGELVQFYLDEAATCSTNHRFLAAIAACREALRIQDSPQVRQRLADSVAIQTKLEDLRAAASRSITLQQPQAAVELLNEVLTIQPEDAIAHGRLGTLYAELGNRDLATHHWKQVSLNDPNDAYGLGMLAFSAMSEGKLQEALDLYVQANEIEPYESKIKYFIGLIYSKLGDLERAKDFFHQAVSIEPDNPQALTAYITTLRQLSLSQQAIPFAIRANQLLGSQNVDAAMVLAEICFESQNYQDAVDVAVHAKQLAESNAQDLVPLIDRRLAAYREEMQ